MRKLRAILLKEWAEVFRNRMVLITFAVLPMSFLALSLGTFLVTRYALPADPDLARKLAATGELPEAFVAQCDGITEAACLEGYLATVYLLLFLLIPVLIPNSFAAYSVVGEKVSRTLEPLLATPIHTWELLVAKAAAAVLPAVGATWLSVAIYLGALPALVGPAAVRMVTAPHWLLALGVLSPLLSLFAVFSAMMVSSLAKEPRTAEMTAGLIVTPVLLVLFSQMAGLLMIDGTFVGVGIVSTALVDVGLAWLAVQVFDREHILTRWR